MTGILSEIVQHKKQEVLRREKKMPLNQLKLLKKDMGSRRSFLKALSTSGINGINIIAEIKRASPSKGVFAPGLDAASIARKYEKGGAKALSVLTDEKYFKGRLDDLKSARKATNLPVLRKDFIVSEYQIYESAKVGADAILLIVRILSKAQLKEYLEICATLSLDALVEVFDEADLEVATFVNAKIVGINNRNLNTFETSLDNAIQLFRHFNAEQIPVALSGIHQPKDIEQIKSAGIGNFLIGESLAKSADPIRQLQKFLGQ